MGDSSRLTLLSVPSSALGGAPEPVRDTLEYFEPEAVVVPGPRDPQVAATVRSQCPEIPVVHPQLSRGGSPVEWYRYTPETGVERADTAPSAGGLDVLAVQQVGALPELRRQLERGERETGGTATLVVVPELSVEWDTTTLSTTLPGRDELARIGAVLSGPVTVLAGGQPAGYSHEWSLSHEGSSVSLRMAGLGATTQGGATFAQLTCTAAGTVAAETVDADQFGLTSLTGVGPATAARLRERGCATTADVRDTAVGDLVTLPGVGRTTAERMHAHADVIETGEPLVLTNREPVKTRENRPPLCLDIETDGLAPTIIWQFGVYDPAVDRYEAFLETESPDDPAAVLERFITWLLAEHSDRTVLTWNGNGFDYPVIEQFLRGYLPGYLDAWEGLWTEDLYEWAVRDGNALLPGRTNKLDHVARALGYEDADTGLTGAQTAAAYREFIRQPETSLDWDRHRAYCRDDCVALWHVYEAITGARRRDVTDSGRGGARGQQTGLTDFQS